MKIVLANAQLKIESPQPVGNPNYIQPYVSVTPKPVSKTLLTQFVESIEADIPSKLNPDEYHITVVYAENECGLLDIKKSVVRNREYNASIVKAEIFSNDEARTCHLVLLVRSPDLHKFHAYLRKSNSIRTTFPDYKPHITIASNGHKSGNFSYEDCLEIYGRALAEINAVLKDGAELPLAFWNATVKPTKD